MIVNQRETIEHLLRGGNFSYATGNRSLGYVTLQYMYVCGHESGVCVWGGGIGVQPLWFQDVAGKTRRNPAESDIAANSKLSCSPSDPSYLCYPSLNTPVTAAGSR